MAKNRRIVNGYVAVFKPDHPKAMKGETWGGYVYEHILMAEEMIDRPLKEGEVVHHLDSNRSNNSPDNLLTLSGPMHAKLHKWLDRHTITPNEYQRLRMEKGCIRCGICDKPIDNMFTYCSVECANIANEKTRRYEHPDRETLDKLVWSKPTTEVAKDFGVSDKAIEKLCKKLDVDKPPSGYWAKVKAGLICPLS
jgi:hypothetical protein